jgi:hypothetical protein
MKTKNDVLGKVTFALEKINELLSNQKINSMKIFSQFSFHGDCDLQLFARDATQLPKIRLRGIDDNKFLESIRIRQ